MLQAEKYVGSLVRVWIAFSCSQAAIDRLSPLARHWELPYHLRLEFEGWKSTRESNSSRTFPLDSIANDTKLADVLIARVGTCHRLLNKLVESLDC